MVNEKRLIDARRYEESILLTMRCWNISPCLSPEEARKAVENLRTALNILKDEPTVDAVEVVHGRWEPHYETFDEDKAVGVMGGEYQTGWLCSVCGRYEPTEEPYCNCGAKMDGGNEDD